MRCKSVQLAILMCLMMWGVVGGLLAGCAAVANQEQGRTPATSRAGTAALTQPTDEPVALSFSTISQGDNLVEGRMSDQPSLRIITTPEQVNLAIPQDDRTPGSFAHVIADQVRGIDYDRFFAIIVLQGVQSSGGYKVTIQQV